MKETRVSIPICDQLLKKIKEMARIHQRPTSRQIAVLVAVGMEVESRNGDKAAK